MGYLRQLLNEGTAKLEEFSDTPRLDAEVLLSLATGLSKLEMHTSDIEGLDEKQLHLFHSYIERRKAFEPVAYIVGAKEFWGLNFAVSPDVIVPRPETESLVERALEIIECRKKPCKILELGTGSGCISVALASELKKRKIKFKISACDISSKALELARQNARQNGVHDIINFVESDWFSAFASQKFDIIISNPPYIMEGDQRVSQELQYEPEIAFYAGKEGLDCIKLILREVKHYLEKQGVLLLEFGSTQQQLIHRYACIYKERGLFPFTACNYYTDLAGLDRVAEYHCSCV